MWSKVTVCYAVVPHGKERFGGRTPSPQRRRPLPDCFSPCFSQHINHYELLLFIEIAFILAVLLLLCFNVSTFASNVQYEHIAQWV